MSRTNTGSTQKASKECGALSESCAHQVIRRALFEGRVEYRSYFMMRMRDRDFNALDMEKVVRFGTMLGPGEHCVAFNNWRYRLRAIVEGVTLEIVIAIDSMEDLDTKPLIIPVTGFWSGKGTRNGKKQTERKRNGNSGATGKTVRQ